MKGLLHEIQPLLEGSSLKACICADERKIILQFDHHRSLLICFKEHFLRFHLTQHDWTDHPNAFSKAVFHHLKGWKLRACSLLNEDRILLLHFEKGQESKKLVCELIPKKSNGYLVDADHHILSSVHPANSTTYIPPNPPYLASVPEICVSYNVEKNYSFLERQALFSDKKQQVEQQLKSKHKQTLRSLDKFENELSEATQWEKVQHEGMLLQANLFKMKRGLESILVNDWSEDNKEVSITLDSTLNPSNEVALRFKKSKKLKRGVEPLSRQVGKTKILLEKLSFLILELQEINSEHSLKNFCQKNSMIIPAKQSETIKKVQPAVPYREFITAAGLKLWVGKSAKDNDQLTFSYANGSDYWLHAHDVPGSHVILHLGKQQTPDDESLQDAIQVALYYSKAKDRQEGEVCITQCKYVKRFGKNQPGKVQISEHRVIYTKMNNDRLSQLRERSKNK